MTTTYTPAPEVGQIAQRLISRYHRHLEDTRIEFIFREPAAKKGGESLLGQARKISGLNAYLAEQSEGVVRDFFVIEIAGDLWPGLTSRQQEALVDHELSHLYVDQDGILSLAVHDVEEFRSVVERHGLWLPDLREFAEEAGRQLSLFAEPVGAR